MTYIPPGKSSRTERSSHVLTWTDGSGRCQSRYYEPHEETTGDALARSLRAQPSNQMVTFGTLLSVVPSA